MAHLHTVLRSLRGETKSRQHLAVFREFFGHLDRLGRKPAKRAAPPPRAKTPRARGKR
jgi:hypothetical protein